MGQQLFEDLQDKDLYFFIYEFRIGIPASVYICQSLEKEHESSLGKHKVQ